MYRILISGYYGFNNIGDESILRAVVDNLQDRLEDIDITVLSQDPVSTGEKYGVKSVNRKSVKSIIRAVRQCDLLISGGGSLLQDVTSKKSIIYYLLIMWMAQFFRKNIFIYSQGIGPINSAVNRKLTARTLSNVSGIVVRDEASKEFLAEIGLPRNKIAVTADPVLRIKPAPLEMGEKILSEEGIEISREKLTVGFAIRERKQDSEFIDELCIAVERLVEEYDAQIVLIPFHYSEDVTVIDELERRLGNMVCSIKHKYLTDEMLSIIGNMDVLIGVRLHALIHAAIMDVPMIAISYDPKINSFMKSIGMKAMCSIYDFNNEDFMDEFNKTMINKEVLKKRVQEKVGLLNQALDTNEQMIKELMVK
ncbi:polysaccharide pyruvyl transferase CsaB [Clostridium aminobutyricum]|uniref:Polysaccharide pyruvyl transferase CsaB n=1 Tax=Clostridium aminobutyricum TaxID=33953 RepID=A0A939D846_CLOAM|nr:polysaccharide pyruvyl transferase CsaB [Clostridium aminobutyricum]MBN7772891.1 polysaccharide pyruvyl transferase CsaB [Clostridium aminobutyricum]